MVFEKHGSNENVGRFGAFRLSKGGSGAQGIAASSVNIGSVKDDTKDIETKHAKSSTITKKKSIIDGDEIQSLLSGSLIKSLDIDSIPIERPIPVGENKKEGLGDIRPSMEVIKSALSGAKFGDRVYDAASSTESNTGGRKDNMPQLTAYCEPVNQTDWATQPLPVREKNDLIKVTYPHLTSCKALPSQWPIDNPPVDLDPFLPWIQ